MNEPRTNSASNDTSPLPASGDPTPSASSTAPDVTRRFAPERLAFFQRIAEGNIRDHAGSNRARAHLIALEKRIAQAAQALELGHLGSARAYLEMARGDFDATVDLLPTL